MFVGVGRFVLQIPGARSIKDRRRVVKSFKDRLRAKLPVTAAEVGELEQLQVATVGVAVIANQAERCDEILAAALGMARTLPEAILADVRTEIVPFGFGGQSLRRGIEHALDAPEGGALSEEDWDDDRR